MVTTTPIEFVLEKKIPVGLILLFSVYFVCKIVLILMLISLKILVKGARGGANEALIPFLNSMQYLKLSRFNTVSL